MRSLVIAAVLLLAGLIPAPSRSHLRAHDSELSVPRGDEPPELDGELDDAIWLGDVARTGPFRDRAGAPSRPYSDARVVRTNDELFLALYAADEDIHTSGAARDVFRVTLGDVTFEVSAAGALRGAPQGTRVGHDADGTLDDPSDDDEEWVIELAIPLTSLGPPPLEMRIQRCDTPRGGARRCGSASPVALRF